MACSTTHDFDSFPGNNGIMGGQSYGFLNLSNNGIHQLPSTTTTTRALSSSSSRPASEVFSDSDDNEGSSRLPSQSGQPLHCLTKKKRRGIIEKRRRDRINTSLVELRRLVPAAFEKQGSQKLEKAEILQLTVEHLRHAQAKGFDSLMYYDTQRVASDYHSMGYRECASAVDRYLSDHEGIGVQDPLRMRLMSHLQCFSAQKAAAFNSLGAAAASQHWQYPPAQNINPHPPPESLGTAAFKPVRPVANSVRITTINQFPGASAGPNFMAAAAPGSFLTSQPSFQPFANVVEQPKTTLTAKTWNPNTCV